MQEELQQLIRQASRIAILTGAGMSTESGIPDYRSTDGLYNTLTSEEVFDIDRFSRAPQEFYKVIGPLYCAILEAQPNAGHLALAALEKQPGKTVTIATQNIDGLHQRAGSRHVCEVHGTMDTLTCQRCGRRDRASNYLPLFKQGKTLHCPCGGVYKPDITFYGESLPEEAFSTALEAFEHADLVMVLGTSLNVYPAAALPSYRPNGCPLVIINRTATGADSDATLLLHDSIGKVLAG